MIDLHLDLVFGKLKKKKIRYGNRHSVSKIKFGYMVTVFFIIIELKVDFTCIKNG